MDMKTAFAASVLGVRQVIGLALTMTFAISAHAQQATTTAQTDTNQQLLQRIDQLEEKQVAPAPPPPMPEPAPIPESTPPHIVSDKLRINLYGDTGFQATTEHGDTNSFQLGAFDLFMTSRLSDKVSALAELVFIAQLDNAVEPDLERMLLQYRPSSNLSFNFGRYHTSIGYYNVAYHNGQWFQTAIGRPLIFAYDSFGGFLPLQETGVSVTGKIPSKNLGLEFAAEIGNGRRHALDQEPSQNRVDNNNGKSFNLAISSSPSKLAGLNVGFSFYRDVTTLATVPPRLTQTISAAHLVFMTSKFEWLNEVLLIRNTPAGGRVFNTPAFYSQISHAYHSYRPYFRYAYENAHDQDPLFSGAFGEPLVSRQEDASAGIRYEMTEWSALKVQYDHTRERGEKDSDGISGQFAFTF
jgi:hypothetical protein